MANLILVINPGSTSTKIAVYEDEKPMFEKTIRHDSEEIKQFPNIASQMQYRKKFIIDCLKENKVDPKGLSFIVARGGLLKPLTGGTYLVNDKMVHDLVHAKLQHASNLAGIIAKEMSDELNIKSYIVDPVVVDELEPIARVSGFPQIERQSIFHALNQKAVSRKYAKENNTKYEELNLIVAHMGGGISVGAHKKGQVIDVNNALNGDGPMSPERSGGVPIGQLMEMCFSGEWTHDELKRLNVGRGGLTAYLNDNSAINAENRALAGEAEAKLVYDAMSYQVAKEIGTCAAVLKGQVDQIILTGGLAYSKLTVNFIKEHVGFIAPITVYPGENEMEALALGGIRGYNGDAKIYS